jgi:hypothetical protein
MPFASLPRVDTLTRLDVLLERHAGGSITEVMLPVFPVELCAEIADRDNLALAYHRFRSENPALPIRSVVEPLAG